MDNLRIIFFGTPEFAVATLGSLLLNDFNVSGVVTVPDKPAGRGRKITQSPVKSSALAKNLPVIQPDNLNDTYFIDWLKKKNAHVFIVVGFRKLPNTVWQIPPLGTINLHASLLPQYRGSAPINRVIMNGETVSGVTTFLINDKIDTGTILMREEVPIYPFENAGDLHDRLMKHGALLVIRTLKSIQENRLEPHPQSEFILPGEDLKTAPKIYPKDCLIDWKNSPIVIHNQIRGLAPDPCANSHLSSNDRLMTFKIFESQPELVNHPYMPGQIISDGKIYFKIACNGGFINIQQLQMEGKRKMTSSEFLRGFRISGYSAGFS